MTAPTLHTPRLAVAYRRYLVTADNVRFATEVDKHYSQNTLLKLMSHRDVQLRRAAALSLGTLGGPNCVESLGRALSDSDRGVRLVADTSFRMLLERGASVEQQRQLTNVVRMLDDSQHALAMSTAMHLIDQAPEFIEAHHQLAVCWLRLENFYQAELAYKTCLLHCRFHYVAWQGLARCRLFLENDTGALNALKNCIQINPDMESARLQLRALRRRLRKRSV